MNLGLDEEVEQTSELSGGVTRHCSELEKKTARLTIRGTRGDGSPTFATESEGKYFRRHHSETGKSGRKLIWIRRFLLVRGLDWALKLTCWLKRRETPLFMFKKKNSGGEKNLGKGNSH